MSSRELVYGKYQNRTTYVLYRTDGSIFKVICEGKWFKIGKFRYYPVRMTKTIGNGTTLVCRRIDKNSKVLDEFYLQNRKLGLWALNEKAAQKGVFHWYNKPKNMLESVLETQKAGIHIIHHVAKINLQLNVGGTNSNKIYTFVSDSKITPGNTEIDPHKVSITGGTYLIYYHYDSNHIFPAFPVSIYLTKQADEEAVTNALKQIK